MNWVQRSGLYIDQKNNCSPTGVWYQAAFLFVQLGSLKNLVNRFPFSPHRQTHQR